MISIIIPVYNAEKYLHKCLDSILKQTYTNYEVIIINDGSHDKSLQVIEEYKTKFLKFKYLEQKNQGASVARNLGVNHAQGKYLLFIDADDYIEENALLSLCTVADEQSSDLVVFGHNKIYIEENNRVEKYIFNIDGSGSYSNEVVLNMVLNFEIKGYICDKMFQVDLWKKLNLFFEYGRYVEDWYPIVQYIMHSSKVSIINEPIYNYVQHSNSSIHTQGIKVIKDYNYAVTNIYNLVQNHCSWVNKDNLIKFKLMTTNEIIHEYYKINSINKKNIYSSFQLENLGFNFNIKEVILCKSLQIKNKFSLICWKLKFYHIIKTLF